MSKRLRSPKRVDAGELSSRIGFPYPPFALRLVRSSFFTWLALRFFLALAMGIGGHSFATPPHWRAALLLAAFPTVLALLNVRLERRGVFQRELGGAPTWWALLAFAGAAAPELLADVLLGRVCNCP